MSSLKSLSREWKLNKLCLLILFFCFSSFAKEPIVLGSKNFSENILLGEMLAQVLENNYGEKVTRKFALGGTKVAFDALNTNEIDSYPDYTGTGYIMILKMDGERDPDKVHEIVSSEFEQKFGMIWSKSIGFNNTYALTSRKNDPRLKGINTISQLTKKVAPYKIGSAYEFMERKDGYSGFSRTYELNFDKDNIVSLEAGLMYAAIRDKQVDFIVSYSTDGRIKAYDLKILKDDKNYFPPYYAAFLTTTKSLQKHPNLGKAIKTFEGLINEAEMTDLNDRIDRLKFEISDVARNFLIKKGILKGEIAVQEVETSFIRYAFSKRSYLGKLLYEHLMLSFVALLFAMLLAIPMGVALSRNEALSKVVFPIINTIQTIPSLALLGFLIPIMGIGFAPAVLALFLYSLLPLVRNTYEGIKAVDRNFVEASKGIGLTNTQILMKVEIPLALPIILAGLRTATVIVIGTATLAALIGAGGFGDPIFRGVSTVNSNLILLGAVPAALLAVVADKLIGWSETQLVSKGIRLKNKRI